MEKGLEISKLNLNQQQKNEDDESYVKKRTSDILLIYLRDILVHSLLNETWSVTQFYRFSLSYAKV